MRAVDPPEADTTSRTASARACKHAHKKTLTVALIGNPNTGKTSLFNALTGFKRHVANYPGVTVDTARGPVRGAATPIELLDLPGTYSLAAMSPDEIVVSDLVCGRVAGAPRPDVILAIIDASNLHRNLYLVSQLAELGPPMVIAVNMIDVAHGRGIEIDCEALSRKLGSPAIPIIASKPETAKPLAAALERAAAECNTPARPELPKELLNAAAELQRQTKVDLCPAEALRVVVDRDGYSEKQYLAAGGSAETLRRIRDKISAAGLDAQKAKVRARYRWIDSVLEGVISRPDRPVVTWSDRFDRILTHKIGGAAVLLVVLFVVFESLFRWAGPMMNSIDWLFGGLGAMVSSVLPEGVLQSLIVDGLISGVGGVLAFLPQILLLFAFIAILEDCGYMSRAAYMMDRLMRSMGLSGRAFIPLLSSFACAVPAIMGTRAIADRRERFVTILVAPFMSCSARLPVYVLLISALVPNVRFFGGWASVQALVMLGMYLVGVVVAIPVAWLLKKYAFAGPRSSFMIELPSYKLPRLRAIWQRMYFSGREFLVRAGTIILFVNLMVWALGYFPHSDATRVAVQREAAAAGWDQHTTDARLAGAYVRDSYLGRIGHAIEPVVEPIGWDWRIGMAVAASFPAREVIIASLSTIYNLGEDADEQSTPLHDAIREARWDETGERVFTIPVALSIMVFFALCAQCASTLVVIGRETRSWGWPLASFTFMTTLAYFAAWSVSAGTRALGW